MHREEILRQISEGIESAHEYPAAFCRVFFGYRRLERKKIMELRNEIEFFEENLSEILENHLKMVSFSEILWYNFGKN